LLEVGMGRQQPQWIKQLLDAKDRTLAAATAKAEGLYLVGVDYPAQFNIPQLPLGPLFLPD
jgi:tRNA pseudouridine38-40 synthase